jgi:hypothetical protein
VGNPLKVISQTEIEISIPLIMIALGAKRRCSA